MTKLEQLLNPRVRGIEISGIRKFYNLAAKYDNVLSLTLGQPDFPTPEHIKEAGKSAIDNDRTSYTPNAGLPALRSAACSFVKARYGLSYDADTETIITNGASEALDIALRTVLVEGCEVILPAPVYPGYEPLIRLMGAVPVHVDTTGTCFQLTAGLIKAHLTDKTRCIILPSPSNPTGAVAGQEELERIGELLKDTQIFMLSDEIYSELVYDDPHRSIAAVPGMRERTIVVNGLSKSHAMTGWRIGFTLAPEWITKHMLKVHQYNATCASSISQHAALEALTNGIDDASQMREEYRKRRDYVFGRLTAMGLTPELPGGAFYIFVNIASYGMSSFDFAHRLLEEQRVAVIPGDAFSPQGEGYVRLSYACSMATLSEGLDRLQRFLSK